MTEELGQQLKKAREACSMTLSSLSDITKINIKFLRLIEKGDWDFLPQPYVRAFIKTYAKEVGLDCEQLLRKYDRILIEKEHSLSRFSAQAEPESQPAEPKTPTQPASDGGALNYLKRHRNEALFLVVLAAITAIILYTYLQRGDEIFRDTLENPAYSTTDSLHTLSRDTAKVSTPPAKLIELIVHASQESWFSISVDDSASHEYTFYPDLKKAWYSKNHFVIRMGNPRGLELFLDGKPLKFRAPRKGALSLKIGAEGIE
ncbi:DUF4115 domain-containing protein [candidate division KSB1 bacterium]|nr:DUF4115 domain-containing protein [candidate division KSB1 bacterium]